MNKTNKENHAAFYPPFYQSLLSLDPTADALNHVHCLPHQTRPWLPYPLSCLHNSDQQVSLGYRVSRAQGSHVTKADLQASNGIIHVIDRVIYPVSTLSIPLILTFDMDLNNLGYLVFEANSISKF
ncbi:hypothetical protein ElyMa_001689700 [Elysia marginata]|uniref:FAS1 domain-containing protein n=1 Tax=Elysia marginata TaxID=1093978 RepID=A0AAV4JUX9_9GAST|nr:hypothetical protein ElyMa_001689700 [Elysia marginata]